MKPRNGSKDNKSKKVAAAPVAANAASGAATATKRAKTNPYHDFGPTVEDLRDAIEYASDVIYTHDLEGNLTSSNAAAKRIFGYSKEESLRLNIRDVLDPEELAKAKASTLAKISGKPTANPYLITVRTKNGRSVPLELNTRLIYKDGVPIGVQGIGRDISERLQVEVALRESEAKFRGVAEHAPYAIIIYQGSRLLYANPACVELSGYSPSDLMELNPFWKLAAPEWRAEVERRAKLRMGGDPIDEGFDFKIRRKDGAERWVEFTAKSLELGGSTAAVVLIVDITERKQAQQALLQSEQRFRELFERNLAGVFRSAVDGRFLACNESFAHILGYESPEELLLGTSRDLSVSETQWKAFLTKLRRDKQVTNHEDQLRRKDGRVIWVLENAALIPASGGEAEIIEGTLIDITDRKRSETEVRLSEERYRQLFQRNMAGVFVSTTAGDLVDCNDSFAHIFGYQDREEMMAARAVDLYPTHSDRDSFLKELRAAKVMTNLESRMRRKDGAPVWVLENVALIAGSGPEPETIQGTLIDITERKQAEGALMESESKFRAVADTASSAIYIHNNKRFLYVNRASEEISGYTAEELTGMSPFELVHPLDHEMVKARAVQRVKGPSLYDRYEYRIRNKSGNVRWVDFSASTIQFGGDTAILGTAFDITERKRVEQMQRALYRIADRGNAAEDLGEFFSAVHNIVGELMEARNFYVALYDEEAKLISYPYFVDENDPAPQGPAPPRHGLTEYVLRMNRPVLVRPDKMRELQGQGEVDLIGSMFVDWMGAPLRSGQQTLGVIVAQSYNEEVRYGESELEMLNFVSQHLASAILRKRQQDALRLSEMRNRSLVQSAVYGIYRSSANGSFLEVNPALVSMLGYSSAEEILGLHMTRDVYVDSGERRRLIQQYSRQGRIENVEVKWKRKDGKPITVRLSGRATEDLQGEIEGFEMIAEDVTEKRALEEQLRQSQKMEAVGRLAGGVAHDFNNLLTVIRGYSELMLDDLGTTDPMRNELEEIKRAADRAAGLTRQLLAFSRQQVMAPKVLDLNSVVGNMEKLLRRLLGEDISLNSVLGSELGRVKADPGQVEQVIMNLAVNARDAMPRGGKLTVETANVELDEHYVHEHVGAKPGSYVMLAVSDTGTGMTAEVRQRIFEPFFTTKELGKGTGLGLSTVYGIVKQSEGYVWVYSEPALGTSFKVYLPRVDAPADVRPALARAPIAHKGTETILLVEDEDGVRALVRQVLAKHGYSVLEARHGGEALLHCERHAGDIELLLTDVVLEQMSGTELATRLASLRPNMKVLYISGYTDDAIVHHGVTQGTHFLQKPFTTNALARKIRQVLDGT